MYTYTLALNPVCSEDWERHATAPSPAQKYSPEVIHPPDDAVISGKSRLASKWYRRRPSSHPSVCKGLSAFTYHALSCFCNLSDNVSRVYYARTIVDSGSLQAAMDR